MGNWNDKVPLKKTLDLWYSIEELVLLDKIVYAYVYEKEFYDHQIPKLEAIYRHLRYRNELYLTLYSFEFRTHWIEAVFKVGQILTKMTI